MDVEHSLDPAYQARLKSLPEVEARLQCEREHQRLKDQIVDRAKRWHNSDFTASDLLSIAINDLLRFEKEHQK
jgi:hypothetical protein